MYQERSLIEPWVSFKVPLTQTFFARQTTNYRVGKVGLFYTEISSPDLVISICHCGSETFMRKWTQSKEWFQDCARPYLDACQVCRWEVLYLRFQNVSCIWKAPAVVACLVSDHLVLWAEIRNHSVPSDWPEFCVGGRIQLSTSTIGSQTKKYNWSIRSFQVRVTTLGRHLIQVSLTVIPRKDFCACEKGVEVRRI